MRAIKQITNHVSIITSRNEFIVKYIIKVIKLISNLPKEEPEFENHIHCNGLPSDQAHCNVGNA